MTNLTPRQIREMEYHAHHAALLRDAPAFYEVLNRQKRKWWNHYWVSHAELLREDIAGKDLLIPGCGEGFDAIIAAKLGANVSGFDISPEMLDVAADRASQEGVSLNLFIAPFECLPYDDNSFDVAYVRDVLHHCDVARSIAELQRVCRPGAWVVIDELYTHSLLQRLRESRFGRWMYRGVRPVIYGEERDYITPDERKLDERDLECITAALDDVRHNCFNVIVNRFVPAWDVAEMLDRALMLMLPGRFVAGRLVLSGRLRPFKGAVTAPPSKQ